MREAGPMLENLGWLVPTERNGSKSVELTRGLAVLLVRAGDRVRRRRRRRADTPAGHVELKVAKLRRSGMSLGRKIYFVVLLFVGFAGLMLLLVKMANATVQATAGAPEIDAAQTPGVPSLSMNLISLSPVVSGDHTVGRLAVYDDPRTARPEDYIELYDNSGQL